MSNHRADAESNLDKAAQRLGEIPTGRVNTLELSSRSEHATALATLAIAQALLDIGDALRAAPRREQP